MKNLLQEHPFMGNSFRRVESLRKLPTIIGDS